MNRGRPRKPSSLPPATISKIARLLFNGFENHEISLMTGLSEISIKQIRAAKLHPEIKIFSLELKDKAIEKIKTSKGKITGLMWFLSRRYPREYADPATQITLASGSVTNNTLLITAEVAEGLIKRSKATLTEIDQLIQNKNVTEALE